MEIRITKGIASGEILDFFSEVNLEYFLNEVKHHSVFSYDQDFQFTALYLHFEQHCGDYIENVLGGGAEGLTRKKSKQYLKHLQRIASTLPAGITVKIKEKSNVTNYRRRLFHLYIEVEVAVSAEYSRLCYSSINECGVVHAFNLSPSMKTAAKAFKERITLSQNDLLHNIVSVCDNKYGKSIIFNQECYHALGAAPGDDDYGRRSTTYKHHGMKDLCGIEQCYGLAWVIAELSAPSVRCRISIENERYYSDGKQGSRKVVRLDRYPYQKKQEPPQLADW